MVDRGACTILFATGTYIDTGCIAVIHTDAVITLAGAAGQCDGMLVGETGTGNLVGRAQKLADLNVKVSKSLPVSVTDDADDVGEA